MDNIWNELAREVPSALAVILTIFLFLKAEEKREIRREANAMNKATEERAYNATVNSLWANNIATLVGKQDATFKMIAGLINSVAKELKEHDDADEERYKRMQITSDLLKLARERQERGADK